MLKFVFILGCILSLTLAYPFQADKQPRRLTRSYSWSDEMGFGYGGSFNPYLFHFFYNLFTTTTATTTTTTMRLLATTHVNASLTDPRRSTSVVWDEGISQIAGARTAWVFFSPFGGIYY